MRAISLALLLSLPISLYGQTVTGNCNATAVGNNIKVEVKCGTDGLSKADAQRLADQYVALAKKIDKGNVTISLILDKLYQVQNELEKQDPKVQTCLPGSICTQGNDSGQNSLTNNFAASKPGPTINLLRQVQRLQEIPTPNSDIYARKGIPIPPGHTAMVEELTFSVSSEFHNPAFQVVCERACRILNIGCEGSCVFGLGPQPSRPAPNIQTIIFTQPILISPELKLILSVIADDEKPMNYPQITSQVY